MPEVKNEIYEGCTVVVQKGAYLKTCRVLRGRNYIFGKKGHSQFTLILDGAIDCLFGSQFRMELIKKKVFSIHKIEDHTAAFDIVKEGGIDNRDLKDDGLSQKLTPEQIMELKHKGLSGKEVIQKITENSTTFKDKTVYSQEKYINKKKKKYGEILTLHRPSVRLLSNMWYTQDPIKIANLRLDSLSQILSHCNVQPGGRFAVFESGTQGLVTAAMLHRLGNTGQLVQIYHGTQPQRAAIDQMNFTQEEMQSLSFINFTKITNIKQQTENNTNELKHISGNVAKLIKKVEPKDIMNSSTEETADNNTTEDIINSSTEDITNSNKEDITNSNKEDITNSNKEDITNSNKEDITNSNKEDITNSNKEDITNSNKEDITNSNTQDVEIIMTTTTTTSTKRPETDSKRDDDDNDDDNDVEKIQETKQQESSSLLLRPRKFVRSLVEDVKLSSSVLGSGVDGLVVACRQHPIAITTELLHFLKPGFPFVVFSPFKEPLMELYNEMKSIGGTNIRLSETWLRHYQVLPQRTHPEINMSGGGGYILYGTIVVKENLP
ncbi:hypothetical protein Pmani_008780 [Petrolisthes manimaculis]|uniref:tRNA (adenine(58)-N(1))-methyltransferase non-catalytic subunit TRM6 n=1 Tax=Petrolisthes manimaculis TaxID=1843537 RepID=A0AAE1Q6B4_9EUCA|nr:hypothetical protein Pmani_008780 [Petrolisthes manimaculis]